MATLEVHDGRGKVERVTISRENPVVFGSNPKCDIVLAGDGVLPFHGRLRWKGSRFKVDASPEAEYVEINGQRMTTASFRQGDEIQVGSNRIFMINPDDEPQADDRTRVIPPPTAGRPSPAERERTPKPPRSRDPRRSPQSAPPPPEPAVAAEAPPPASPQRRSLLERDEWVDALEAPPPSAEVAVAELELLPTPGKPARPRRGWGALFARQVAPGEERILSSPLVLTLLVSLAALIGLGLALHRIIADTVATRTFNRAIESYEDGDYRNAIRRFDEFLAARPNELKRSSKARVLRALADVRQFTSTTGASWSHALEAERTMFKSVRDEPAYRDASDEFDELILRTGEMLADRARTSADARTLAEAEQAVALHQQVAGQGAADLLQRSRLPAKLGQARAAVRKERDRRRALDEMDAAVKAGSSARVYAARDTLVGRYADLAQDPDVVAQLNRANELIRRAVTFDPSRRPAETEPHPEPLGPPTSLIFRVSKTAKAAGGPLAFALADGLAYGLDGASGTPLWQVSLGLSSPFAPQAIPGGTTVLAVDARHDELVRLDARTGKLLWRQPLDEPVRHPPLILGNQIIQPTLGGKVLLFDLASGERQGAYSLGLPLSQTPVGDETGQHLYVLADKDCLFVLSRDPAACATVEYLGHAAGSVAAAPARVGRFLIVPDNHGLREGRWRVLVIDADGTRLKLVQQVPVAGWSWGTPAASGSVVWAVGDRGGASAFAIGSYEQREPLRLIARLSGETETSGPAFALARTEHEVWVGSGRSARLDLDVERAAIGLGWTLGEAGPALAPPQMAGPLLVLTQQNTGGPGVALWGVAPQTGEVRWRTLLGAPWPVEPTPASGGRRLTSLGLGGEVLELSADRLNQGGFLESTIPGPDDFRLPAGPVERLEAPGHTVLVPGPHARHLLTRVGSGRFQSIAMPAPLGASPILWGRDLLVPADDGRAYLIDPGTGESRAEPYVPPFDRNRSSQWWAPLAVDGETAILADDSGRVRRLSRPTEPRPRLVASAEVTLDKRIIAPPALAGPAIVLATADGRIRALAARDLSPIGAWPVEAPLALAPTAAGSHVFIADTAGGVLAIGPDGRRAWSTKLDGRPPVGPPVIRGASVWFLTRSGRLLGRALASGEPVDELELGVQPAGGLLSVGSETVVPTGLATLRPLSRVLEAKPKSAEGEADR